MSHPIEAMLASAEAIERKKEAKLEVAQEMYELLLAMFEGLPLPLEWEEQLDRVLEKAMNVGFLKR